jgi:hypothetical protein
MKAGLVALAVVAALSLPLASCAKKAPPAQQPAGQSASSGDSESDTSAQDSFPVADAAGMAKSKALNSQGFDAYQKGNFSEAAKLFAQAVDANSRNDTAWYNEACSLGLARAKNPDAASLSDILDDLTNSLTLNSDRATKLKTDTDLASLRDEESFKALVERFNGQERPVLLKLKAVDSFEGDIAVSFTDLDNHRDLDFHGGDMPLDELAKFGIVKGDGDRYVPGDVDAGTPYYARYKDVSGPAGGEGEGGTETVTTHPVLLSLDLATGFDSGA